MACSSDVNGPDSTTSVDSVPVRATITRSHNRFDQAKAALAGAGAAFAWSNRLWLLVIVALTGTLSTEVVESGPFTSLEQAMLASELEGRQLIRGFGLYNAVAA